MVEFIDGSTIAQASPPDMHLPIALAMAWPERVDGAARAVDWTKSAAWTFEPLDHANFPAVELAKAAGRAGGTKTAVLNAANEEAVDAFVAGKLPFLGIVDTVAEIVESHETLMNVTTLAEVKEAEDWARAAVHERVSKRSGQ
jgi:1-deoxy-D-xylulose-5-phosphate reductoisomerase